NRKPVAAFGAQIDHGLPNRLHPLPEFGVGNPLPLTVAAALGQKCALRRLLRPFRDEIQDRPLRGFEPDRGPQHERSVGALLDPDLSRRKSKAFCRDSWQFVTSHAALAPVDCSLIAGGLAPRIATTTTRRVEESRRYLPDP